MAGNPSHNEIYLLFLDSYAYERSICQDERKIKVIRAYYGRKKAFKCGFGLDTNCEAKGSEGGQFLLSLPFRQPILVVRRSELFAFNFAPHFATLTSASRASLMKGG